MWTELDLAVSRSVAAWLGRVLFGVSALNTLALVVSGVAVSGAGPGGSAGGLAAVFAPAYTATLGASSTLALTCGGLAVCTWFLSRAAALWLALAALLGLLPLGLLSLGGG